LPNKPTIAANIFMNGDNIANVRKDLDQSAWEWGVDNALKNLMQIAPFQSSQPVLQQIAQARKRILIRPAHAGEETHSDPVAGIDSYDYTTDGVIDATPQGSPPLACAEGPVANRDLTSTPRFRQGDSWDPTRLGTGTGSDVCLYFTSQDHLKELMKAGGRPDEVLLHELVHSLRMMLGCSFCTSMPDDYDTVEEFHAILIANIYRSECGYTNLRKNHFGKSDLPDPDEGHFYSAYQNTIDTFTHQREMWVLTHTIATVRCTFNPIRRSLLNPAGQWK
jgi:hypothetical protein